MRLGQNTITAISALILFGATVASQTLGAITGAVLALLAAAWFPIALIPILMFAGAYQLLTSVGPLQFGWVVVVGAFAGFMVRVILQSGRFRLDPYFVSVALLLTFVGMISLLLVQEGRLDRLAALIMLLILVSYLTAVDFSDPKSAGAWSETSLVFAVALGAVITTLFIFAALQLDLAGTRRSSELGIGFGEYEGGSSNISRILSYATVVLTIAGLSLRGGKVSVRLLCFGVAFLAFIGTVYTGSRMPVIASVAAISLAILWSQFLSGRRIRAVSVVFSITVVGLIAVVASVITGVETVRVPFLPDQEVSLRVASEVSIDGNVRLEMWQQYFDALTPSKVLFGGGVGSFGNPHSVFVGSFVTFGIFGVAAVIFLLTCLVFADGKRGLAVSVPLTVYLFLAFSSSSDIDRTQFWILLAITFVLVRARGNAFRNRHVNSAWQG